MHDRLGFRRSALCTAVLLVLCGCSGADERSGPPQVHASTPTTSGPTPAPSDPAPTPTAAGLETPATSSGPLTKDSFPTPATLGARWEYSVDPGDAEEGYLGNGTPALERDPREVAQLAVPFGCPRPHRMPVSTHALEVDYTAGGMPVIAIRQSYTDAAEAGRFFAARADNLTRCRGRSGGPAIGVLVGRVDRLRDGVLLSDRTPQSDPWTELAVLDDDQVVLVAARTGLGRPPMTPSGARRLAALFRR